MINKINIFNINANNLPQKKEDQKPQAIRSGQVSQYSATPRLSANYFVPFLGRKDYTENEKEFYNFKRELAKKMHKCKIAKDTTECESECYSSPENTAKFQKAYEERIRLLSDKDVYEKLKSIKAAGISDPVLTKSLNALMKIYTKNVANADDLVKLELKQNEISQKYNCYKPQLDGKTYSMAELGKMKAEATTPEEKMKIYNAMYVDKGDTIADDLVELVKTRNEFAKKNGYENYYSYLLKEEFNVDEKKLFDLMDDLDGKTSKIYAQIMKKGNDKTEKLDPTEIANKYINDEDTLVDQAFKMYKKMGWDVPNLPIKFDLFPRENKNTHGFCFDIDPRDTRILANLHKNEMYSVETLNHEMGHCVYEIGLSERLPFIERVPASEALTEAFAMMMAKVPYQENFFAETLDMPKELSKDLENQSLKDSVKFIRRSLKYINFEREMYKNPEQNLPKLWAKLEEKYENIPMPEKLNNKWATTPHYLSYPVYYQSYLRAEVMAAQIYDGAVKKLGPLTQNEHTADFFKTKMFRHGSSLTDNQIIKNISGKDLSVEAYCDQLKKIKLD